MHLKQKSGDVQEVFEGVLEHLGMASELQVIRKDHGGDDSSATRASERYGQDARSLPESTSWTRLLGAMDCLQVRYMRRPSNEYLLPALAADSRSKQSATFSARSPENNGVMQESKLCPVHERAGSEGGNAIDAEHSVGMSGYDDKLSEQPGFADAGAPDSVLPNGRSEQKQSHSETADSECSIM